MRASGVTFNPQRSIVFYEIVQSLKKFNTTILGMHDKLYGLSFDAPGFGLAVITQHVMCELPTYQRFCYE